MKVLIGNDLLDKHKHIAYNIVAIQKLLARLQVRLDKEMKQNTLRREVDKDLMKLSSHFNRIVQLGFMIKIEVVETKKGGSK